MSGSMAYLAIALLQNTYIDYFYCKIFAHVGRLEAVSV